MLRHKMQAVVIAMVLLVSTASATLGFALLAASNTPFTHAFGTQRGADVTVTANAARASSAELAATGRLGGVTAAAGPFAEATVQLQFGGQPFGQLVLAGRASPGGSVDDLVLNAGHWPDGPGQVVLDGSQAPGQEAARAGRRPAAGQHSLGHRGTGSSCPDRRRLRQLDHEHRRRLGHPRRDRPRCGRRARRPARRCCTGSLRPAATPRSAPTWPRSPGRCRRAR